MTFTLNPAADPQTDLEQAAAAIRAAGWWQTAGLEEHWPLTTDEVAQLLEVAGEYDIDAAGLAELVARRVLGAPGIGEDGSPEWNAADVILAVEVLSYRSQLRATPSRHDPFKHPCQVKLEQARQLGAVETIVTEPPAGCARFDLTHLLAALVKCENREGRLAILPLLKATLEVDHGVFVP
jgi:hypothetical protein